MDYHCLELAAYRNSRYELVGLLEDRCIITTEFERITFRIEQSIEKLIPGMPFSEERLALFLLVYLGADIYKPTFLLTLNSKDGKLLCNEIESIMGEVGDGQNHCGAKIIKELLGCQE